ncbi:hypothetical protein [Streptosporangium sp. G12]
MGLNASSEALSITNRINVMRRHHPDRDLTDLRQDLAEVKIADYIKAVVSSAPPLKPEAADRIANLLRSSATSGEAA